MEGDTELGLVVKNALDALDMPVLTRSSGRLTRFWPVLLPRRKGANRQGQRARSHMPLVYACSMFQRSAVGQPCGLQLDRTGG